MTTIRADARVWVADPAWVALSKNTTLRCRMTQGSAHARCPNLAIAQLRRGYRQVRWWAYCGHHLYGRRLSNGVVEWLVYKEDA